VINDSRFLDPLGERDKRAGMAEAVKVALIKNAQFFNELYEHREALAKFQQGAMSSMIFRCAELHLAHIRSSGDPFELGSARPLDFGHWSAHCLEAHSHFQLRHGEAVAMGIALDALYSLRTGMITRQALEKIWTLLVTLGFELQSAVMDKLDIRQSLEEFREHLGGVLCITLLTGIGTAVEVNDIDLAVMENCLRDLRSGGQNTRCSTKAV